MDNWHAALQCAALTNSLWVLSRADLLLCTAGPGGRFPLAFSDIFACVTFELGSVIYFTSDHINIIMGIPKALTHGISRTYSDPVLQCFELFSSICLFSFDGIHGAAIFQ